MARTARTNARRKAAPSDVVLREALLDERTRRLAGRADQHEPARLRDDDWLVCEIGEALYALPLSVVVRAKPLSRLGAIPPSTDASLVGLAAENGRVLQVFDLAARLNLAPAVRAAEGYLVILRRGQTALRVAQRPVALSVALAEEDGDPARVADAASPLHGRMVTPLALETLFPPTPRLLPEPV